MKRDKLLTQKLLPVATEDPKDDYIKKRGNKIEELVRVFYEKEINRALPAVSCVNTKNLFLLATLDGFDGEDTMIEVKLLTSRDPKWRLNEKAPGYIKWKQAMTEGIVPEEYYPQLQHQMAITGLKQNVFLGYAELKGSSEVNKENTAIIPVPRNEEYIDQLVKNEIEFWNEVTKIRSNNEI